MIDFDRITLGILAGGRASRLDGADKALLEFRGESLLQRTLRAFPENFHERLLSYNRTVDTGKLVELRVVADLRSDYPGPLAAIEALAAACDTPWLFTVPVDCRQIPPSLVGELFDAGGPDGAVVRDSDGLQPLLALWPVAALRSATVDAFSTGELAVHKLVVRLNLRIHDISPRHIGNLNTPADFQRP